MHFTTCFLLCVDLSELKKWEIEEGHRLESLYRNRLENETIKLKTEINNKIEMIKVKLKENLETTKLRIQSQLEKERQVMTKEVYFLYNISFLLV